LHTPSHEFLSVAKGALKYLENQEAFDKAPSYSWQQRCKYDYEYAKHLHEASPDVPPITAEMLRGFVAHGEGAERLIRGGTWQDPDFGYRGKAKEDTPSEEVGFRVALPYLGKE
jgi:hypothetical protein